MAQRLTILYGLCAQIVAEDVVASSSNAVVPQAEIWAPGITESSNVRDLHNEYNNVFKHGNRNAASHKWSSFLMTRAHQMTESKFEEMSSGYCAVSGSPVQPNDYKRYRLTLDKVGGGKHTGFMYYCCWPCVCDTQDFIKIDTKNVTTAEGSRQYHFAVIGNPCDKPEALTAKYIDTYQRYETSISQQAPEVRCGPNGEFEDATLSDHGYIIISMFFDAPGDSGVVDAMDGAAQPGRMTNRQVNFQDEREFAPMCEERAAGGYKSGMGEIFRKVSGISPVPVGFAIPQLAAAASSPSIVITAEKLAAFYQRMDPSKLENVAYYLNSFHGRHVELNQLLFSKYGEFPVPMEQEQDSSSAPPSCAPTDETCTQAEAAAVE